MKVNGPSGAPAAGGSRPTRSAGGFSVSQASGAAPASAAQATAPASSLAGVSALMALQGVETATERRRRAVRRGSSLLDRLDELKLAMLSGEAGEGALERLGRTLREDRPEDPDAELTGLLEQIDLRAAVELAKAEVRRNAA
ncbi:MAG: flagellar assembly protein FliX [Alphaproteobacteria bacterium]|nr:flagellar assembly protein FliX [Alphaproteobacteria bacterium]MBU2380061.1 flagellar assembly protein FliX [Alphaproteobacteria bacterium]